MGSSLVNRTIIDNMPCFIYWKGSDATYSGCNILYAEKMGIDPADIVGKTDSQLEAMSGGGFVTDAVLVELCAAAGEIGADAEFSIGDGENEKWFSAERIHVDDTDGVAVLGIIFEIPDKMRRRAKSDERPERAKSDFLSCMSHELCTPLNAIINMSHFSKSEDDASKVKSNIAVIHEAANQLFDTVNDILDMSRIELGQANLVRLPFELNKVLTETCGAFTSGINGKGLTLRVNLERDAPNKFRGDEFRLSQVIESLLKIIAKAAPDRGGIDVYAKASELAGGKAILEFRLTSTGLESFEEGRVCFNGIAEQFNATEYRHYGEAGLEISVCKKIAELMGGNIKAEYADGAGVIDFTVRMDVFRTDQKPAVSDNVKSGEPKLLYVTCDAEAGASFRELMDEYEIRSACSEGLESALSTIEEANENGDFFSIAFIDHHLPEIDGIETAKRVREISCGCTVIILISISEWKLVKEEAISAGFKDFLSKPPAASHIIDIINRVAIPVGRPDSLRVECDQRGRADGQGVTSEATGTTRKNCGQAKQFDKYLPYIDIEEGLSRFGGNKKLFAAMLKSFKDGVAFTDLKKSINKGDLLKIQQDCSMLVSVAMSLSLTKLHKGLLLSEGKLKSKQNQKKALSTIEGIMLETNRKVSELLTEWE